MEKDLSSYDTDLVRPEWYPSGEHHEIFRRLRDEDPLHWAQPDDYGRNFWVVTRYDDMKAILNDAMTFSSSFDSRIPRSGRRLTTLQRRKLMWDASVTLMDPPLHTVMRQPMNKHFSTPMVGRMRADIEKIVDEIIEDIRKKGTADVVDEFAAVLPMHVVFKMLGIPESDWDELGRFAWQAFSPADPRGAIPGKTHEETSFIGIEAIGDYSMRMARDRLANPRDDLASIIARMVVDGTPLDEHEIAGWFLLLILGGLETTRNAISVGMWCFLKDPEQRQLLIDDPTLIDGAVDEIMRWTTPARGRLRVARASYKMHGKTINPGDWVVLFAVSGNKDERKFDNPHKFDIRRTPNEHLSLGEGIHACLGRALVRLELKVLFSKIFSAFPDIEFAGDDTPHWVVDHQVTGLSQLMVKFQ
ncbi:cytochrome P450 [Brucella sp. 21LCYQ03]|nr:cytochrome P450 [Brucella sp. 21LCYQ03]